jgi:hypothetical protein
MRTRTHITPAKLARIAKSSGGPRALAKLLRVGKNWVYRRISGETPIEHVDDLAIRKAVEEFRE